MGPTAAIVVFIVGVLAGVFIVGVLAGVFIGEIARIISR
ncbi:hypothetical protein [Burkholderia phage vB_BglM_WTB]